MPELCNGGRGPVREEMMPDKPSLSQGGAFPRGSPLESQATQALRRSLTLVGTEDQG